ncbi:MAG: hypothetical protein IKF38_04605 [Clostridia bacterium]|nr:hypothetical protein [Clostridia bacterium]
MKRPIVVEFSGLPNSGKTTLLHGLKEILDQKSVSAVIVQEQAELLPQDIPKGSIEQNLWITLETLQKCMEMCFKPDVDYVLLDRGFYNQYFWVKLYASKDSEYSRFMLNFMDEFAKRYDVKPDFMYVVDVDVEDAIRRRMASGEPVTFSKKDFLIHYKEEFEKFYKDLENTLYIDTTGMEKQEVVEAVCNEIIML